MVQFIMITFANIAQPYLGVCPGELEEILEEKKFGRSQIKHLILTWSQMIGRRWN